MKFLNDLIEITGIAVITYGFSLISAPAGWIVGGVLLVGYANLKDRS